MRGYEMFHVVGRGDGSACPFVVIEADSIEEAARIEAGCLNDNHNVSYESSHETRQEAQKEANRRNDEYDPALQGFGEEN